MSDNKPIKPTPPKPQAPRPNPVREAPRPLSAPDRGKGVGRPPSKG